MSKQSGKKGAFVAKCKRNWVQALPLESPTNERQISDVPQVSSQRTELSQV